MRTTDIKIKQLLDGAEDAVLYRKLRLQALAANPEAFGSSFEQEEAQPLAWFSERLASSTVLGAFREGELFGDRWLRGAARPEERS